MKNLIRIAYIILIVMMLPVCVLALPGSDYFNGANNMGLNTPEKLSLPPLQKHSEDGIIKGLNLKDNGVAQVNDGQLLIKVSGYSDSALMKFVTSMNCTLSRKYSLSGSYDTRYLASHVKTASDGIYVKGAIEAEKGSNIFFLATTGLNLKSDSNTENDELLASSNIILGGGIGYFLDNCSMQFGYDNMVGVSASLALVW